jgi:tetraacyldisaccharide 4'-kinase
MRERLESVGPLILARLNVELLNEKEALSQLVQMVSELDRRKGQERPVRE